MELFDQDVKKLCRESDRHSTETTYQFLKAAGKRIAIENTREAAVRMSTIPAWGEGTGTSATLVLPSRMFCNSCFMRGAVHPFQFECRFYHVKTKQLSN